MTLRALGDAGPLVAILDASEECHSFCVEALSELRTPLITTWPVLTEAAYLLRHRKDLVQRLILSTAEGFLFVAMLDAADAVAMVDILHRYDDQHFQLADVS